MLNKMKKVENLMSKWNSGKRKNSIRKDAKFNTPLLKVAQNLVALGFTEKDLGIVLGCKPTTIASWKARYPEFFNANKKGKQILKGILVAQMMRAAEGYDYTEQTEKCDVIVDGDGNEVDLGEETLRKKTITEHTKHQAGNAPLMMFLAQNLLPEMFPRDAVVAEQNILNIIGGVEAERLLGFAGKLQEATRKVVEGEVIEAEVIESKEVDSASDSQG